MSGSAARAITRDEFQGVSSFLYENTGIRLVPGKEALVMGRLDKRLRQLETRTYGEYLDMLREPGNEDEARRAIDLLTTNETYFFRERRHFDFISEVVVPEFRENRPLRVWSAASSTGEEAYTVAMVLAESMPDGQWQVMGTDVSSRVVESAQRGIYPIAAAERIPRPLLRRYCLKGRDEYAGMMAVSPGLRSSVTFMHANLMSDLRELGNFDVILLRNVMIYFEQSTRVGLVSRLREMLNPGGYLMVGLSETLNGMSHRLRSAEPSIYRLSGRE